MFDRPRAADWDNPRSGGGRSLDGPTDFQCYVAWKFTFGPEFFHAPGDGFGHR
jgi:hypothetical protein